MKLGTSISALAATVSLANVALGQTPNIVQPPGGGPVIRGYTPPSPQEQAIDTEIEQLDNAASAALDAGRCTDAEIDAREALSLGQDSGVSRQTLAASLYIQGKNEEALQEYQVMASQGYNPPRVWLPYALLLLKSGQWAQAVAAFQQAMPMLSDGELVRANSDFSANNPRQTELATAIHISMGLTMDGGDFHGSYQARAEQALSHFQQAVTLEPDSPLANYYYAYGLQRMGRTAQAQAAFAKTIKIGHGGVQVAARKALAKIKQPA